MPVAAPLAIAGATIGGSLISSSAAKKASNAAAQAQTEANQAAIGEQQREFDINQQNFAPWLAAGRQALGGQLDLLGLNGDPAQQAGIVTLQNSPLYQSLYRNGQNTILANASATGGLRGGNLQNSLANFGSDTLATVIQQQLANLGGLSGQGLGSAGSLGNLNNATGSNISNLFSQSGSARSGGILANGAINSNNINNIFKSIGSVVGNIPGLSSGIGGGVNSYGISGSGNIY